MDQNEPSQVDGAKPQSGAQQHSHRKTVRKHTDIFKLRHEAHILKLYMHDRDRHVEFSSPNGQKCSTSNSLLHQKPTRKSWVKNPNHVTTNKCNVGKMFRECSQGFLFLEHFFGWKSKFPAFFTTCCHSVSHELEPQHLLKINNETTPSCAQVIHLSDWLGCSRFERS